MWLAHRHGGHETEQVGCVHAQSCLTLGDPTSYGLSGSSVHGISDTGVGCHVLLQGISQPGDQTCVSCTGTRILYHRAIWEAQVGCGAFQNSYPVELIVKGPARTAECYH